MPARPAPPQNRILPVDAARGFVMLMVFLSHIKQHFVLSAPTLYWILISTTRIATPTFLLLSGFVARMLLNSDSRDKASVMLIDRGLFLLTIGHLLLGIGEYSQTSFADWMFARTGPVEAIGFGLCIVVLMRKASASTCATAGGGLFIAAWLLEMSVIKRNIWVSSSDLPLTGFNSVVDAINATELLNDIGVFLIGVSLSAHLKIELANKNYVLVGRRLCWYGVIGIITAFVGIAIWHLAKDDVMQLWRGPEIGGVIHRTLDPGIKDPPSPAYLLVYGGAGLLLVSTFFRAQSHRLVRRIASTTAVIGRASLMCFIVQEWLFLAIPQATGRNAIHSAPFWLAYFVVCTVALFWLARWWGHIHGNRLFTVGLKHLARRGKLQLPRWRSPDLNA